MIKRPRIALVLLPIDKFLEFAGWILIIMQWAYTLLTLQWLPDTIPTHFDFSGNPDAWGSKFTILIIPIIASLVYVGMTILNQYPHIFNYPTTITKENAQRQYTLATRLIRYLKVIVVAIFAYIHFQTVKVAQGVTAGIGQWLAPVLLVATFIPLVYYLFRATKNRNS